MRIRWAQNALWHMYEKYNWTPRTKYDDWVEHTFRKNCHDADWLANEGVRCRGKETLRILYDNADGPWKYLNAYWDGAFKRSGNGGCGWIISGANNCDEGSVPQWIPILCWCSGVLKDDCLDNCAVFMETCSFVTLIFVLKNLAAKVPVRCLPQLLEIALDDRRFKSHLAKVF